MHDYFRGNPDGQAAARVPRATASRSRPSTATATRASPCWTSTASRRSGCSRRSACSTRSCSSTTSRRSRITFTAFNRWLDEDWGFAYQDRIFAAPYISLADLDWAVARARVGARPRRAHASCMRPAAPHTADGPARPRATRAFDPFWARVQRGRHHRRRARGRQRLLVATATRDDGFAAGFSGGGRARRSIKAFAHRARRVRLPHHARVRQAVRALPRTCASRRSRTAPSSSRDLFKKLRSTDRKMPGYFTEDPVETFRRNVWINPFWEDDVYEVVELMGADRVIFGSDWPHIEGMPQPLDYAAELKEFDDDDAAQDPARQRPRAEHPPPASDVTKFAVVGTDHLHVVELVPACSKPARSSPRSWRPTIASGRGSRRSTEARAPCPISTPRSKASTSWSRPRSPETGPTSASGAMRAGKRRAWPTSPA